MNPKRKPPSTPDIPLTASERKWQFGGIYADPGITGTRAEKRPDFMRMIQACRDGQINKILVKSISRFARNTVDALNYIREQIIVC